MRENEREGNVSPLTSSPLPPPPPSVPPTPPPSPSQANCRIRPARRHHVPQPDGRTKLVLQRDDTAPRFLVGGAEKRLLRLCHLDARSRRPAAYQNWRREGARHKWWTAQARQHCVGDGCRSYWCVMDAATPKLGGRVRVGCSSPSPPLTPIVSSLPSPKCSSSTSQPRDSTPPRPWRYATRCARLPTSGSR